MVNPQTRQEIREAFQAGELRVEAAKGENVGLHVVPNVLRHRTPGKRMVRVVLEGGRWGDFTEDHSVFILRDGELTPVPTASLALGVGLVIISEGRLAQVPVIHLEDLPPQEYTYDLSVPGPENFRLTNGILAHNSYSIGGVSLDIEKSSKYESLKQNAESMFDKSTEAKARTVKYIRGLQQPRFGVGVRSAFGAAVGRGILSPRNFLVFLISLISGPILWYLLGYANQMSSLFS